MRMVFKTIQFQIQYIKPYSFEKTVHRLRTSEKDLYQEEDGVFYRAVQGEKEPLLISFAKNQTDEHIDVTIYGSLNKGEEKRIKGQVARMLSTENDLTPFYAQFSDDPFLNRVIDKRKGMHVALFPTLYECLISTIIQQQLNQSFAAILKQRFIKMVGNQVEYQKKVYPIFPHAEQVAALKVDDLRRLQFSQRKAEYIIDLSRKLVNGELDLESLKNCSNEEIMNRLLPIRGIGKWTVECLLIFGYGRQNVLPAADIGLRRAVQKVYQLNERPSEAKVRQIAQSWAPFQSYVTYYLWDYLSDG